VRLVPNIGASTQLSDPLPLEFPPFWGEFQEFGRATPYAASRYLRSRYKFAKAEKRWKGIQHPERLRELFAGIVFVDGVPANETRRDPQQDAA